MNNFHKELFENFDSYVIGVDDTFKFKCRECGKCCKNREDIMLTTRDIYNIAKKLGIKMEKVMEEFGELYIGHSSHIPIVRLKPRGANKACPLLADKRCRIHDSKPVVCALFPLGRIKKGDKLVDETSAPSQPTETAYILQKTTCGSITRTHTVRSWLEKYGIPVEDKFYEKWNDAIFYLTVYIHKLEDMKATNSILNIFWQFICSLLYVNYDTSKEFMPQFEENMSNLKKMLDTLFVKFEPELKKFMEVKTR